jgi:hypothetical protein
MSQHQQTSPIPDRLPFRLPDFTRYAWVSNLARECWEPRVRRIVNMLQELEWRTIMAGHRRCALQSIPTAELDEVRKQLVCHGIEVEPLQGTAVRSTYSSSLEPCTTSNPAQYWCALGRAEDLKAISQAYRAGDQSLVGELLGYPRCCNDFFHRTWVEASLVDTTWPMAVSSTAAVFRSESFVEITFPSLCGMQLRWLGVRAVYHLPCSFECAESLRMADLHLRLARDLGLQVECGWLEEMLRWPAEWSALHGIAEIRCPVVKVVTRTDPTPRKLLVRYHGDAGLLPEHAGAGLVFPFRRTAALPFTSSRGFQLGLVNPITSGDEDQTYIHAPWYPRDNGFATRYAMDRSHAPIVERVKLLLAEMPVSGDRTRVVDLGCGNGALSRKICMLDPALTPSGVERDSDKIAHAKLLNPNSPDTAFLVGDLFDGVGTDSDGDAFLTILMLGRLVEVPAVVARDFLNRLSRSTRHLLVYAYDDYLRQVGSLSEMAERVGLKLYQITKTATVELALASMASHSNLWNCQGNRDDSKRN